MLIAAALLAVIGPAMALYYYTHDLQLLTAFEAAHPLIEWSSFGPGWGLHVTTGGGVIALVCGVVAGCLVPARRAASP